MGSDFTLSSQVSVWEEVDPGSAVFTAMVNTTPALNVTFSEVWQYFALSLFNQIQERLLIVIDKCYNCMYTFTNIYIRYNFMHLFVYGTRRLRSFVAKEFCGCRKLQEQVK